MKPTPIAFVLPAALAILTIGALAQQPGPMARPHQMMAQHEEIGKTIDRLLESIASIENEKDPTLLKNKLAEHAALLKELKARFQENSQMTGMMGMPGMMGRASQQSAHPMNMEHAEHTMGFSQTDTTHHFLLTKEGGIIQVEAKNPEDTMTPDLIRTHLAHIATAFAAGDFSDPMAVHDQVPSGVPALQRLKSEIRYTFEAMPEGGRVVIQTKNAEALKAVYEFLRFQIREHQTGDSGEVN